MEALQDMKLNDFKEEKIKYEKDINGKNEERIKEDEIYKHIVDYLTNLKDKRTIEKSNWDKIKTDRENENLKKKEEIDKLIDRRKDRKRDLEEKLNYLF